MSNIIGLLQGLKGVIGPSMPKRNVLIALAVGVILGLLVAYGPAYIIFFDSAPNTLHQSYQDEWVKLLADRYAQNPNAGDNITLLLREVDDPLGIVDRLISDTSEAENRDELQAIRPFAEQAQTTAARAPQPNILATILPFIYGPLLIVLLASIAVVAWNLLLFPFIEPTINKMRQRAGGGSEADQQAAAVIANIKAVKELESRKTVYDESVGPPIMQKMSRYVMGHGQYDDSFSIEDADDRFLGECGATIAETIGTGSPESVTAIEVWLFDKDDPKLTPTAVYASAHAFNDPAIRSKLDAKGEVVLAEPGATLTLETGALRLQARVVEVEYGTEGSLPPNSYFERIIVEIATWQKEGSSAAAPAAPPVPGLGADFSTAAPVPPSQPRAPMPSPNQPMGAPPPGQGQFAPPPRPPAQQPPLPQQQPPRRQDDDPFGGTGDFTPLSG